jgi:hypothetical protein
MDNIFSTILFHKSKAMILIVKIGFSLVPVALSNPENHEVIATTTTAGSNQTNHNSNISTTADSDTKEFTLMPRRLR